MGYMNVLESDALPNKLGGPGGQLQITDSVSSLFRVLPQCTAKAEEE